MSVHEVLVTDFLPTNTCYSCEGVYESPASLASHHAYFSRKYPNHECGKSFDNIMSILNNNPHILPFSGLSVSEVMAWMPGWHDSCEQALVAYVMEMCPEIDVTDVFTVYTPNREDVVWYLFDRKDLGEKNHGLFPGVLLISPWVAKNLLEGWPEMGHSSLVNLCK
jgi:hypothetical protein